MKVLIDDGITYEPCDSGDIAVYLVRKRAGTITLLTVVGLDSITEIGYQYVTTSGDKGEIFETCAQVKESLEGDRT